MTFFSDTIAFPNGCSIWGDDYTVENSYVDPDGHVRTVYSERTDGDYAITLSAQESISRWSDHERAKLTRWLVEQRSLGETTPKITTGIAHQIELRPSLSIEKRAENLLFAIHKRTPTIGSNIALNDESLFAYAASESTKWEEVDYLLTFLHESGWMRKGDNARFTIAQLTVAGHNRIESARTEIDSTQAFVAMWFDPAMDELYDNGIEPAVKDAGFCPCRVDKKPHLDKIDDRIVAEIQRSRFLVADMTYGENGHRGSVYYEVGFAHGLNIPVIFTCKKGLLNELAFDIRQYPHIAWQDDHLDKLREALTDKIRALIRN